MKTSDTLTAAPTAIPSQVPMPARPARLQVAVKAQLGQHSTQEGTDQHPDNAEEQSHQMRPARLRRRPAHWRPIAWPPGLRR